MTRSLHVASNFAFCSVVNVFFFLQPETILDIPYASLMAFYYVIKSTHLIQRTTMSKSNFLIYSTSGSPGLQKKESSPEDFVMGGGGVGLGTKATSHSVLCHLPFQWSGSRGDTFLVYSLTDTNCFCQRFSFLSFFFSDPTTSSTPPL